MHINSQSRQRQIVRGAASLFRRRGYQQVSLKELATEVGITAPALYKHFSGKSEILHAALSWGLSEVLEAIAQANAAQVSFHESLADLTEAAIEHRDLWILIHRDLRNLDETAQAEVRRQLREIRLAIREILATEQPAASRDELDVRARAVIACMAAPAEYPQKSTGTALVRNIAAAAANVSTVGYRTDRPPRGRMPILQPFQPRVSRREQILASAADLFAQRGYDAVGVTDIGGAVGISGPSVYSHFETKIEILETLMRRAVGWIEFDRALVFAESSDPCEIFSLWVHRYAQMATSNRALFVIYTDEIPNLPDNERRWVERSHQDYFHSWVSLVGEVTALKDSEANAMASCALSVINDLSGSTKAHVHSDFVTILANIAVDLVVPVGS
ncbi:TetR/AcrR family transcriptional regulator [Rhodococcus sp. USK13]|uniref:TetR/AcrR family transcriptional regulator n=1 Tax=Rhodococcus sp. USK13 TaxID=2806442 RepID=UPI001BD1AE5F|nr:TetR/AcrR family transcriptional regulator [Rhodococcus sp. USK13]